MTSGIHHITVIAADGQKTVHFYSALLGLRLVKKTVNQDDTDTYHLFFGDKLGHPGMDLTFFIFQPAFEGVRGNGQVTTISFSVPISSLSFWQTRFKKYNIKNEGLSERFGKKRIIFYDNDSQRLELVGVEGKELETNQNIWTTKEISKENVIRNFYSATLSVPHFSYIDTVLSTIFGFEKSEHDQYGHLYELSSSKRGAHIELLENQSAPMGIQGAGTVHHIAFRAPNEKIQMELRARIENIGLSATAVIDRFYFKSVYFMTPARILFEIATDGPGFTADENEKTLGTHLALPPFLEGQRKIIEKNLPPIHSE